MGKPPSSPQGESLSRLVRVTLASMLLMATHAYGANLEPNGNSNNARLQTQVLRHFGKLRRERRRLLSISSATSFMPGTDARANDTQTFDTEPEETMPEKPDDVGADADKNWFEERRDEITDAWDEHFGNDENSNLADSGTTKTEPTAGADGAGEG